MEPQEKQKIKEELDKWVAEQFYEKNRDLIYSKVGISLCDRCPLDPVAFTPEEERQKKAERLLKTICPGQDRVVKGHVIILWDDPEHLDIRARRTHKNYRKDSLKTMQEDLCEIYNMLSITKIDCRFISFYDVIKNVSRIIHLKDYSEADIHNRLIQIKKGEVEWLKKKD